MYLKNRVRWRERKREKDLAAAGSPSASLPCLHTKMAVMIGPEPV